MNILCIDIGNTNIHFGLSRDGEFGDTNDHPTAVLAGGPSDELAHAFQAVLDDADGISFCSVVPAVVPQLNATLERFGLPVFHLTHKTCNGLPLRYPKPEEIGQDRLANALAAQSRFGMPTVVIDMGTAVTFDIVTREGGYEGGIIAPGLQLMTRYLHEQTALLPQLRPEDLVGVKGAIGKSTVHAMQLGVAVGFSGMINALRERVVSALREREGVDPVVLSTGGSVANLTRDWVEKSQFVGNLTLMGLTEAFRRR